MAYQFDRREYEQRMRWYTHARFGMFIHWGLYAIPARGEWVRSTERIPSGEYDRYAAEFDPRDCAATVTKALAISDAELKDWCLNG